MSGLWTRIQGPEGEESVARSGQHSAGVNLKSTGSARNLQIGPAVWLKIPVTVLKFAKIWANPGTFTWRGGWSACHRRAMGEVDADREPWDDRGRDSRRDAHVDLSRGRQSHSDTTLYISLAIPHTKYTG